MPKTLYICYFGLREPLVQTQVLPYLFEIMKDGIEVGLLTFEPNRSRSWSAEELEKERQRLKEKGIAWHHLPYHKRPSVPATLYDAITGARLVRQLMGREDFDILHCRIHIPALMAVLARKFSRKKPKIIFDIRGFFPEEYTDAGIWPAHGLIYRAVKRVEKSLLNESDGFVVLTEKARDILFPESAVTGFDNRGRPIEVIPCCVDLNDRFADSGEDSRGEARRKLDLQDRFVITHVGALGGLYLTDDIADFLQEARSHDRRTFALFLTQSDPSLIVPLLEERGFGKEDFLVTRVGPSEVKLYLMASDMALSFVRSTFATASRSPTKIPEYLACGLPILSNSGVGDVDQLIEKNGVGVLLNDFSKDEYRRGLSEIQNLVDVAERCRATAAKEFDLEKVGGERYRRLYQRMLRYIRTGDGYTSVRDN